MIETSSFSIVANNFPNEKEAMIGYIEASVGLGRVVGLLFTSFLF